MSETPDTTITRRGFIGAGAAAGAGGLILGADDAEAAKRKRRGKRKRPGRKRRRADVVVIGGGLAGLAAAREIRKAGRSVIVVEARDRVGGRVWNHTLPGGEQSEGGGTFVGPTQNHVLGLADELGVDRFLTYNEGRNVAYIGDDRSEFTDTSPTGSAPPDPLITPELATVITQLDELSTEVPVDAPWQAARAGEWDAQTLESYIRDNSVSERFRSLVGAATRPIFGAEPRELSLLFVLFYIAASGDERHPGTFERNFNTRDGAQQWRFAGGSQTLAFRMAADLGPGTSVLLRTPARRVAQTATGVTVTCDRHVIRAKHAIVAVPPALAARIDFQPALPANRDQLGQRVGQGALAKVAAVYDRPFWRAKGFTGQSLSTKGLVSATFDDSPPDGSPGVIFGFVGGDRWREYVALSPADRRGRVLGEFARLWGSEALRPVEFTETLWPEEPWSRGGPVGIHGPGTLFAYGSELRRPVGRIHWAGTETSTYWNGYMDGAIRSGRRAAKEVLEA